MDTFEINLQLPDLWQQEAMRQLRQGKDVVVHAPTGAGKTYIFELLMEAGFNRRAVFTVPTRALANDKLLEWRERGWDVGIATGDLAENLDARVIVATLETQKSKFLKRLGPALFVIDEYQMLGDSVRGLSYELALALLPPSTQLLLLSGSVGNPEHVVEWLQRIGRDAVLVSHEERPVPQEEVFLDALPGQVPGKITGYWPRLLARALMADLGPVLVFAPQRKGAEQLARMFAAAYPVENPLVLTPEQKQLAGPRLAKMLARRVVYHHSGLSYRQRAGLVEPLAKAGQLRIVVATTGLASGINFSMRSVLVSDREYRVSNFYAEVRPDELLQMFGRAGRRGLDEIGYILVAPERPRLMDARPLYLKRSRRVDWPSLLGVMHGAVEQGRAPFEEAIEACQRLFSVEQIPLGVERSLETGARACGLWVDGERASFAQPDVVEMRNSRGEWERKPEAPVEATLGEVLVWRKGRWRGALEFSSALDGIGEGNFCRLPGKKGRRFYGREVPVGNRDPENPERVQIVRPLRRKLRENEIPVRRFVTEKEFREKIVPLVPSVYGGG
ncbi:MAG TPA: DEAD/DEAH box helicase, partial [Opitutales bacterium]|nr:DEAD/DEAH box helicase [Opitutales bacterium]